MDPLAQYTTDTPASVLLADASLFSTFTPAQKAALAFMAQTDERHGLGEYVTVATSEGPMTPLDIAQEPSYALLACIALGLTPDTCADCGAAGASACDDLDLALCGNCRERRDETCSVTA